MMLLAISTVYSWVRLFAEKGSNGLKLMRRGRPVGSGRKLSPKQELKIQGLINNTLPSDYGLNYSMWISRAVTEFIQKKFNVQIAPRTVRTYLKRWNFTPQRPQKKSYKQDPMKVAEWLGKVFPGIVAEAKKLGATILFGDETHMEPGNLQGRSYAPKGQTPTINVSGSRFKINIISTLSSMGEMRYMLYSSAMNCRLFIIFLGRLINGNKQMVFLIVDNLKVHHGKLVTQWLKEHQEQIRIFYLPAYSPELNPDEYLNNLMKQMFHSRQQPNTKEELTKTMQQILRNLQRDKNKIKNLFKHKNIKYAA
jgi:transposase